jgi:hypothetical protein
VLIVKPIQDKTIQKEYCEICGTPYIPAAMAFYAEVDGKLVGVSQFTFKNKQAFLECLAERADSDDWEAMFIMGRATMSFIETCGIYDCFCRANASDEGTIKRLGFRPNEDGAWFVSLKGFFEDHCKHN